ncbi:MAG: hypothetical protein AAGH99_05550 [Planctomycetota bacterium]
MSLGMAFGSSGLCRVVSGPAYGRQELGYAPGGPADRFAAWVGNTMLEQDRDAEALEVVHLPEARFVEPTWFVMSGAPRLRPRLLCNGSSAEVPLEHAVVYYAEAGDRLMLGRPIRGLRTYVCTRPNTGERLEKLAGRRRPAFEDICQTFDADGAIRITPGPEHDSLVSPRNLWDTTWRVTREMSDVGLRLEPAVEKDEKAEALPEADPPEITSGPVADGTVQLTPAGPLVLMRQRPTLGGYPRIGTVIDVDIDRLAQYAPGHVVRWRCVSVEEAVRWYRQREEDLALLIEAVRG